MKHKLNNCYKIIKDSILEPIDLYIFDIIKGNKVTAPNGKKYQLHSNIDAIEGTFINNLIVNYKVKNTLEIGCAYGLSSLYICKSRINDSNSKHYIIDPNQSTDWHNIGIYNLTKCGVNFFELIEKSSSIALPQLLASKINIDFCLIDGWHSFDQTLIDFFYCDKLIPLNGIIVIDDVQLPSVQKVIRYITSNLLNYKIIGSIPRPLSNNRKLADFLKQILNIITKIAGKKIQNEFLSSTVYQIERSFHLNSSLIAFQKTNIDERSWFHFEQF